MWHVLRLSAHALLDILHGRRTRKGHHQGQLPKRLFHHHLFKLAPNLDAEKIAGLPGKLLSKKSIYNTWLQAGFLIMAARSLGLDCGPMIGFDVSKINEKFYSDKSWRASMLMNLGYGVGGDKIRNRAARLDFSEACEIV